MSGGRFEYLQYRLDQVADEVDQLIEDFDAAAHEPEAAEVRARYALARDRLREAAGMLHRIDWYVSGDDGLESFLRRWERDGLAVPRAAPTPSNEGR